VKTVLVTGAAGFIGNRIIHTLTDWGHQVYATEHHRTLPDLTRARCARVLRCDLRRESPMAQSLRQCDAIVHAAAQIPQPRRADDLLLIEDYLAINTLATRRLAEASHTAGIPRFIYLSTAQLYAPLSVPARETAPIAPGCHQGYLLSKLGGEWQVNVIYPHTSVILRLGTVYGLGGNSVIDTFWNQARTEQPLMIYGSGRACVNPVWIGDVTTLIEKALFTGSGLYNVSGPSHRVLDIALAVCDLYAKTTVRTDESQTEGPSFTPVDTRRATEQWRYVFTPLAEGLRQYAQAGP